MSLRRAAAAFLLAVLAHTAAAVSVWAAPSPGSACGREVCACRHACAPRTAARPCHGVPAVPEGTPRLAGTCGHAPEAGPLPALSPFLLPTVEALAGPRIAPRDWTRRPPASPSFPHDPESPPPRA